MVQHPLRRVEQRFQLQSTGKFLSLPKYYRIRVHSLSEHQQQNPTPSRINTDSPVLRPENVGNQLPEQIYTHQYFDLEISSFSNINTHTQQYFDLEISETIFLKKYTNPPVLRPQNIGNQLLEQTHTHQYFDLKIPETIFQNKYTYPPELRPENIGNQLPE